MELYAEIRAKLPIGRPIREVAKEWALDMATGEPNDVSASIEIYRHALLQAVKDTLIPWTKNCKYSDVVSMLTTLIELDRANALYNMKMDRSDVNCPAGFMWCTEADLEKYGLQSIVIWNEKHPCRASITSHYMRFANLHGFMKKHINEIEELLQPCMPIWILDKYGKEMIKHLITTTERE